MEQLKLVYTPKLHDRIFVYNLYNEIYALPLKRSGLWVAIGLCCFPLGTAHLLTNLRIDLGKLAEQARNGNWGPGGMATGIDRMG